jgi:hypothetical protein
LASSGPTKHTEDHETFREKIHEKFDNLILTSVATAAPSDHANMLEYLLPHGGGAGLGKSIAVDTPFPFLCFVLNYSIPHSQSMRQTRIFRFILRSLHAIIIQVRAEGRLSLCVSLKWAAKPFWPFWEPESYRTSLFLLPVATKPKQEMYVDFRYDYLLRSSNFCLECPTSSFGQGKQTINARKRPVAF